MAHHLPDYDYSQPGLYFVTICVLHHRLIFGKIIEGQMHLNPLGEMAQSRWNTLTELFPHIKLHESVIMPNHMHGIIELVDLDIIPNPRAPLEKIVRAYKGRSTYAIRRTNGKPWFAWEEDFFDIVVRHEKILHEFRQYILNNPAKWQEDRLYKRY